MAVVEVDPKARRRSRDLLVLLRVGQEDAATLSGRKDVSRIVAARVQERRGFRRFRRRIGVRFMVRREVGALLRGFARVVLRGGLLAGKDGRRRLRRLARLVVRGVGVGERVGFGESCECLRVSKEGKWQETGKS